jgi:hypothetical protein
MLESTEEIRRKRSKEMETDVVDGSSGGREAVVSFSGSFGKTGHRGIWKCSSEADSGGATAHFRDENGLRFTGDPGDVEERPWVEEAARSGSDEL